ncbi:MAG: amidohydrolase family protein [Chloroflexi bacterium]|nr:amidohydrolase family protein [Chloroflexota bacterium]
MAVLRIDGMVDPHVHLRDLAWAHKATFASETAAALAGGYWAVLDMPNTPPSTINRAALDTKLHTIGATARCDWGVYLGASQADNTGEFAGTWVDICGLKIFCNDTTGDLLVEDQGLRDRMYAAWTSPKPIAVHAEGETVLQILELVRQHRRHTHFLHISTAEEIGFLRAAKVEGLPISVGVCPHHLFLTDNDVSTLGAFAWMKPVLKTANDVAALWDGVRDGVVDVIESDHAPHTREEKLSAKPPYGVPGLETTLPLMLTAAHDGCISKERVVELVSTNPRRLWGLTCPPETYALIDLDATYTIDAAHLHSACGWSPYAGMQVTGKVIETRVRGALAYDGERVLAAEGFGQRVVQH